MKPVVIIGGGGHARSVLSMLGDTDCIVGYADAAPSESIDVAYLGTDKDVIDRYTPDDVDIHIGVGFGHGCSLTLRRKLSKRYAGFHHASLISPSAWIADGASIADGCAIMARAVINCCRIGCDTVVNTAAIVEHGCHIGENVFIGPGAILCGEVTVGDDVFIGAGAVIRQGVKIESGTIVGMGAVVVDPQLSSGLYVGNPAKKVR